MKAVTITLGLLALVMVAKAKKPDTTNTESESLPTGVMLNSLALKVPSKYMNKVYLAFKKIKDIYGKEFTKEIEKVYRYETGHFDSTQFKNGYSPGMVAQNNTFPFGWTSLQTFAKENGLLPSQFGTFTIFVQREGRNFTYVKFPSIDSSVSFVAWFLKNIRNGVVKYWNTTNEAKANEYQATLNQIIPRISNLF
jgi:hypothetical protein